MATPAERLAALAAGENPLLVARVPSGYFVLAEDGYLPGYGLLIADPLAYSLEALPEPERLRYLEDLGRIGEIVSRITGAKRMNYGILGNVDPFLHCHLWPRYTWEEAPYSTLPPLAWPAERRASEVERNRETHLALLPQLRAAFA